MNNLPPYSRGLGGMWQAARRHNRKLRRYAVAITFAEVGEVWRDHDDAILVAIR